MKLAFGIFYPRRMGIVTSVDAMSGILGKLMRLLGCTPTHKYVSDISLIHDIKYMLKENKTSVLMYPEAGYSFDGRTTTLPRGLGFLMKRLEVPVVTVITQGAFHRDPLYNMLQIRDVRVSAHVRCIATVHEIKEKTVEELDGTPLKEPHLCDKCGECVRSCPGHAISDDGRVDPWQCAVYYNGANGTKNPFMPPDAFADLENRIEIISGEAKVTPEVARKILRNIYFYPPAQHAYQCSICGRACDMGCYIHLEEKGLLSKEFKTPFRKREEWKFKIEDFES